MDRIVEETENSIKELGNGLDKKSFVFDFSKDNLDLIIKNSNLPLLAIFLILYVIIFIFYTIFGSAVAKEQNITNTFDVTLWGLFLMYALYYYIFRLTETEIFHNLTKKILNIIDSKTTIFSSIIFLTGFQFLLFLLRLSNSLFYPTSLILAETITWFLFIITVVHNILKTFFNIDLLDSLKENEQSSLSSNEKAEIIKKQPISSSINAEKKEVFNISNNLYTYDDAQAVCKAFDSRLATYDEIESAYENGAEWCNYGWSSDQMAFFPTQKSTWKDLQQSNKHKNSCGRPGVNGGYFENPNIKFGVNCYGVKPKETESDAAFRKTKQERPYPKTEEENEMDEKVKYWKENSKSLIQLNSFNKNKWSRY